MGITRYSGSLGASGILGTVMKAPPSAVSVLYLTHLTARAWHRLGAGAMLYLAEAARGRLHPRPAQNVPLSRMNLLRFRCLIN